MQCQQASLRNLENQIEQLASALNNRPLRKLPIVTQVHRQEDAQECKVEKNFPAYTKLMNLIEWKKKEAKAWMKKMKMNGWRWKSQFLRLLCQSMFQSFYFLRGNIGAKKTKPMSLPTIFQLSSDTLFKWFLFESDSTSWVEWKEEVLKWAVNGCMTSDLWASCWRCKAKRSPKY